jgi:hypothetical protein
MVLTFAQIKGPRPTKRQGVRKPVKATPFPFLDPGPLHNGPREAKRSQRSEQVYLLPTTMRSETSSALAHPPLSILVIPSMPDGEVQVKEAEAAGTAQPNACSPARISSPGRVVVWSVNVILCEAGKPVRCARGRGVLCRSVGADGCLP